MKTQLQLVVVVVVVVVVVPDQEKDYERYCFMRVGKEMLCSLNLKCHFHAHSDEQ